jgi:hypothetical protein
MCVLASQYEKKCAMGCNKTLNKIKETPTKAVCDYLPTQFSEECNKRVDGSLVWSKAEMGVAVGVAVIASVSMGLF